MTSDRLAAVALIAGGVATLVAAAQYGLGTLQHLGPGAFPLLLGLMLTTIGVVAAMRGYDAVTHTAVSGGLASSASRAAAIVVAVSTFGWLIDGAGLSIAAPALILIASLGRREPGYREVLLLASVLTVLAAIVFVWALGLPLRLWPAAFGVP